MVTKNTFSGGRVLDIDPNSIQPDTYVEAHNVELVGDSKFFALKNIKGTTEIDFIKDAEILGVFETFYKINTTENVKCLTIFTCDVTNFNIFCYDLENTTLYQLYQESTPVGYLTDNRIVDARSYAENGIDILYFTDEFNEIRQLRCEIPAVYSANFLSEFDLSLQRWGANGTINVDTDAIQSGGSLLSGTYQFAYRMCDPDNKRFTKWSSLTNPIHVYNTNSFRYSSGYGMMTSRKIRIDINPSQIELDNFDYFQLAVIENVYPSGAFSENDVFYASLLPIEAIANRTNFEYKSNYKIGKVSVDELTVDYSALASAKTLAVSKNRLFAGNISYENLEFDNTPTITGSVATIAQLSPESTNTRRKGYFRGEVYRFGIVYFDKYGNKSPVHVLDMTSVTGNQISGAVDMKFPSRSTSNSYAILDGTNNPRSIGLSLTVDNHPTWAVGFEIVREERIKKILFQSPVVPYSSVKGIGAFYKYPSLHTTSASLEGTSSDDQPMTSDSVYVSKNLLWPELRNITGVTASSGSGINTVFVGEAKYERQSNYNICALYPQDSIFNNKAFVFNGNEQLETVDFVHLKLKNTKFDSVSAYQDGDYKENNMSSAFAANLTGEYFFDNAWVAKSISESTKITDNIYLDNYQEGTSFSGLNVNKFSDLDSYGLAPNSQRSVIVKLSSSFQDEGATARNFAVGNRNAYSGGSFITGTSGPTYDSSFRNTLLTDYTGWTENAYVQSLRIVNCVNPQIGDLRYGAIDSQRNFISTGARYTFSPSEITNVEGSVSTPITIDVWGGDCFISFHTFKVADSSYSIVNNSKNIGTADSTTTLISKWGRTYHVSQDGVDPAIMLPLPLDGNSQFVSVYLESEYEGYVLDNDTLDISNVPSLGGYLNITSKTLNRTSLTYNYNLNLSKNNTQKIYLPKPAISFEQYDFNSRIHYTDLKLYNSSESGFDVFRVANYFDQEESGGPITKLCLANDNLYSVQDRRISYLPVGERLLEATDASIIAVGTSDVLSDARVIDQTKGGQHIGSIVEEGGFIFVPDVRNKAVYILSEQELTPISDNGNATLFRSIFGTFSGRHLRGLINPIKKEYWLFDNGNFCHVFNYSLDKWTANYEFTELQSGIYANQSLYVIEGGTLYTMYTGTVNNLAGTIVIPRVSFYVNPEPDFSKTFDNQMFVSTDRLDECDYIVYRETALGNQTVNGTSIDVSPVENNYRIKTLRDVDGARLRGVRLKTTVKWSDEESTLSSVITKWRSSSRKPY